MVHLNWFLKLKPIKISKYSTLPREICERIDSLQKKIIYNSYLAQSDDSTLTYYQRKEKSRNALKSEFYNAKVGNVPSYNSSICLKYLKEQVNDSSELVNENSENVSFPFGSPKRIVRNNKFVEVDEKFNFGEWADSTEKFVQNLASEKNWVPHDANTKRDALEFDNENEDYNLNEYGTADPNVPVSSIPCGGCGALLHCKDTSIPGFIPKETFYELNDKELMTLTCQRCYFLKEYDIALRVYVSSDEYPLILSQIRNKKALVLLMVDLTDYPCSIWPNISNIIGNNRPIVVIGNKIDLIMEDSPNCLTHIKESLVSSVENSGVSRRNIKHVGLISAKTGYGVEELITAIHVNWRYQGDVYIVGCTNVGKSSLFNALIQSDFCKVQAVDLMQRATVSEWPGTTLNLLRFPILRPSTWRLQIRKERLLSLQKRQMKITFAREDAMKKSGYTKQIPVSSAIGQSFLSDTLTSVSDPFSVAFTSNVSGVSPLGVDANRKEFIESKWCYDTPGVVQNDQLLNILTTSEIMKVLSKKLIIPRIFHLKPGHTIFIGALSRMDYVEGPDHVWFSVFASDQLPLTVVKTEDADDVYNQILGTDLSEVPKGGNERLQKWPSLESIDMEIVGKVRGQVAADVVLSSSGWIAVTLKPAEMCHLKLWCPDGRGIHKRTPPLLRFSHRFHGSRLQGRPVFRSSVEVNHAHADIVPSF